MKELTIKEGEWKYRLGQHFFSIESENGNIVRSHSSMGGAGGVIDEEHAKAICKAVNNTYHKGIDPEAAEDMKEALKECNEFLDCTDFNNFDSEDWAKVPGLIEEAKEALKKAGVNLNEKAEKI